MKRWKRASQSLSFSVCFVYMTRVYKQLMHILWPSDATNWRIIREQRSIFISCEYIQRKHKEPRMRDRLTWAQLMGKLYFFFCIKCAATWSGMLIAILYQLRCACFGNNNNQCTFQANYILAAVRYVNFFFCAKSIYIEDTYIFSRYIPHAPLKIYSLWDADAREKVTVRCAIPFCSIAVLKYYDGNLTGFSFFLYHLVMYVRAM